MRISWEVLGKLIDKMSDEQRQTDVTIEIYDKWSGEECYSGELVVAGPEHDSLDEGHPMIFAHNDGCEHERESDIEKIISEIGLLE